MPGGLTLKWHGDKFNQQLRRSTASGLKRAGAFLHRECRKAVSTPNTGTRHGGGRDSRGRYKPGHTTYDNPSKPGEPPHLRTGTGRGEIVWEYNGNERDPAVRVGVTKKGIYMFYLELGTRLIAPRPWLLATSQKFQRIIGALAATGGKRRV